MTKPVVDYTRRHLRLGWWSLLAFATLGLGLESLHGFKIRAYLDVSNETRRLMWTLAHAHGTLLAILNIVFGLSLRVVPELTTSRLAFVSSALAGATEGSFSTEAIQGLGSCCCPSGHSYCWRRSSGSRAASVRRIFLPERRGDDLYREISTSHAATEERTGHGACCIGPSTACGFAKPDIAPLTRMGIETCDGTAAVPRGRGLPSSGPFPC